MKRSIVRTNLMLSLGFGLLMGCVFPLYASFFVEFKSTGLFWAFCAGCLAAGLIVGLTAFTITRITILRSVRIISTQLHAMATDSGATLRKVEIRSDDVVGELASGFNTALEGFLGNTRLLRSTANEAVSVSDRVETLVGDTVESIETLIKTAETMGSAVGRQDRVVSEMDDYFGRLNKAILLNASIIIELYSNLNDFGKILTTQTESIDAILKEITRIAEGIGSGTAVAGSDDSLLTVSSRFGKGADDTVSAALTIFQSVRAALNDIEDISDRTNVLSINASIEAARMGSSAMGFRIIAANIKNLAGEVQTLTSLITGLLERGESQLQEAAEETRTAMNDHEVLVRRINESIVQVGNRRGAISQVTDTLNENQIHNQNLLGEIRENMGVLKSRVTETQDVLKKVVENSTLLKNGVETLFTRTVEMRKAEESARESLEGFKNHLAPLVRAIETTENGT